MAALVERHFGQEAVDRLADPLLSGIYGGDAAQLSAQTVLPRLVEMETKYGSLTRGMLAAHKKMRAMAKTSSKGRKAAEPAIFTALRGGMQPVGGCAHGAARSGQCAHGDAGERRFEKTAQRLARGGRRSAAKTLTR